MNRTLHLSSCALAALGLGLAGCAVVEPEARDIERVRAAVVEDPAVPIEQLSRELGISDAAVIAALPESARRQVPIHEVAGLLAEMQQWGEVELYFEIIGHELVYRGVMPRVARVTTRQIELVPAGDSGLSLSIAKRDIASVWLVRYPAGNDTPASIWFCEELGQPWLIIRVQKTSPGFNRAWDRLD